MKNYLIEPRDPLIVRDGRPMLAGMPQMKSLDFPLPSTLAGLARTREGTSKQGRFDDSKISALRARKVRGPWLVTLDDAGKAVQPYWPAPRDGIWARLESQQQGDAGWQALRPHTGQVGTDSDLAGSLEVVGTDVPLGPGKSGASGAAFWSWRAVQAWLIDRHSPTSGDLLQPLPHERRMHVAIDSATGTALDGALFATDGLRFWSRDDTTEVRAALAFQTDAEFGLGLATLGGERRLSHVRTHGQGLPELPPQLLQKLAGQRRARLLLATPACFSQGSIPTTLHGQKVVAARVGLPEIMSGWDMEKRGPKPTRRLVSAGSVYWVELPDAPGALAQWLQRAWASPASEQNDQDRVDGFGMTFVGVQ